jgi:hypothetical protein
MSDLAKEAAITDLITRKGYSKAIELIQSELKDRNKNERLRLQLAHVHLLAGSSSQAVDVLSGLADDLADDGFAAKAIAILKKMQKIAPGPALEARIARLVREKETPTVQGWAPLGSVPPPPPLVLGFEPSLATEEGRLAPPVEPPPIVHTPLFSGLSPEEALAVVQGLRLVVFEPGEIIVSEGEPGASLFIISSGTCRVFLKNRKGHNAPVRQLHETEFFGEISLLRAAPRSATVTAATPVELLELDRATVDKVAEQHPQVREVLQDFYQRRANSTVEASIRAMGTTQA